MIKPRIIETTERIFYPGTTDPFFTLLSVNTVLNSNPTWTAAQVSNVNASGTLIYTNTTATVGYTAFAGNTAITFTFGQVTASKARWSAGAAFVGTQNADVTMVHGLVSDRTVSNPDGAYFSSNNGETWKCKFKTSAGTITVDSGLAPTSNINNRAQLFDIEVNGNRIDYFINEKHVATITNTATVTLSLYPTVSAHHTAGLATTFRQAFAGMVIRLG